jgi:carbamoyl-phosphate synthase large subunit
MGYTIYSTGGTSLFLKENGIHSIPVGKIHDDTHPNVSDLFALRSIDFAIVIPGRYKNNLSEKSQNENTDGYIMRRMAVDFGIPIFTNTSNAAYFVNALKKYDLDDLEVKSWQEYMAEVDKLNS